MTARRASAAIALIAIAVASGVARADQTWMQNQHAASHSLDGLPAPTATGPVRLQDLTLGTCLLKVGAALPFACGAAGTDYQLPLTSPDGSILFPTTSTARLRDVTGLSVMGRSGTSTGAAVDLTAVGGYQALMTNAAGTALSFQPITYAAITGTPPSPNASWGTVGSLRWYCVSYDHGNDANVGYSDTSGADCGTKAVKTWTQLQAILPTVGAGRLVRVLVETRASGAMYLKPDGVTNEPFVLNGLSGYGSVTVRGTVTDATGASTAFQDDTADQVTAGAIRVSGTNAGGYNVTSAPSTFVLNVQLAGGGSAGLASEASNGISTLTGHRVRFDAATATTALRGATAGILSNTTGQITLMTVLPATPTSSDVFYIDDAGVQFASITTQGCYDRLISITGINTPGNVAVQNGLNSTSLNFISAGSSGSAFALSAISPVTLASASRYRNGIAITAVTSSITSTAVDYGAPGGNSTFSVQYGSIASSTFGASLSVRNPQSSGGAPSLGGLYGMSGGGPIFLGNFNTGSFPFNNRLRIVDPSLPLNNLGALNVYTDASIWGVDITTTGGNFVGNSVVNGISIIGSGLRVSVDDAIGSVDGLGISLSSSSTRAEVRVGYNAINTITSHAPLVGITGQAADISFGSTIFTYASLLRSGYTDGTANHISSPITVPTSQLYGINTTVAFAFGAATNAVAFLVVRQDPATPNQVFLAQADTLAHATGIIGVSQNYSNTGAGVSNLGQSVVSGVSYTSGGLTWLKYDATPTIGHTAYLSDVNPGQAKETPPSGGTAVALPLGVCVQLDGSLCLVKFALPNLSNLVDTGANGWVDRIGPGVTAARTFISGTGMSISNADGTGGNPTFTNTSPLSALTASDGTLVVAGTDIKRAPLTGDIACANGSNACAFRSFSSTSLLARAAGSSGVPTELQATADNQVAQRFGGTLQFRQLDYSQLSGAPSSLPPSGAAGGALTGTYPNPGVNVGAGASVTGALPLANQAAPTGTGFPHVTTGGWDPAARAIDLSGADVTSTLPCSRLGALSGDVSTSGCTATLLNIPNATTAAGDVLFTNTGSPGTPAAGKTAIWTDTTSKTIYAKNDAGVNTHMMRDLAVTSHLFVTGANGDGSWATAQPAYTDLTGTPTSLPPSGAAGGALTGSYPNPSIANGVIVGANFSNFAANTLFGNPTGSSAAPTTITLGTGLSFSGGALNVTVAGGADALGSYWVSGSAHAPANAINWGALGNGVHQQTTSGGVSTPNVFAATAQLLTFGAASGGGLAQDANFAINPSTHVFTATGSFSSQGPVTTIGNWSGMGTYAAGVVGAFSATANDIPYGSGSGGLFTQSGNFQYNGTSLGVTAGSDSNVLHLTSSSTGTNPQLLIESSNTAAWLQLKAGGASSFIRGDGAGNILESAGGSGGIGLYTNNFGTQAASISSAGVWTFSQYGTGIAKLTSGALGTASSADVAAAITWPASGDVLYSSGTSTAPSGSSSFAYNGTSLAVITGGDSNVLHLVSGSAGTNPQLLIESSGSAAWLTLKAAGASSTIRGDGSGNLLATAGGSGGIGFYTNNFGTQGFVIGSSGTITFPALSSGGTQCAQLSASGQLTGTGSACGTGGGSSYTFSTGLTNASSTITADLSTGVFGGQQAIGGTSAGNLILVSNTSHNGMLTLGHSGTIGVLDESTGKASFGQTTVDAEMHVVTSNDTAPGTVTAWDARHFVVGASGSTAGGFGVSTTSGTSTVNLSALAPNSAWWNLRADAQTVAFYSGGSTLGFSQDSSANVSIATLGSTGGSVTADLSTGRLRASGVNPVLGSLYYSWNLSGSNILLNKFMCEGGSNVGTETCNQYIVMLPSTKLVWGLNIINNTCAGGGSPTWTATVYKNGSPTSATTTVACGTTGAVSVGLATVSASSGDVIGLVYDGTSFGISGGQVTATASITLEQ